MVGGGKLHKQEHKEKLSKRLLLRLITYQLLPFPITCSFCSKQISEGVRALQAAFGVKTIQCDHSTPPPGPPPLNWKASWLSTLQRSAHRFLMATTHRTWFCLRRGEKRMWARGKDPEEGGRNYFNMYGKKASWHRPVCLATQPTHLRGCLLLRPHLFSGQAQELGFFFFFEKFLFDEMLHLQRQANKNCRV